MTGPRAANVHLWRKGDIGQTGRMTANVLKRCEGVGGCLVNAVALRRRRTTVEGNRLDGQG